jgi:transposase
MMRISQYDNEANGRRRRRWTVSQKAQAVRESMTDGVTVSSVARKYGIPIGLLFRWRRLMAHGDVIPISPNHDGKSKTLVEELKQKIWDLERLLGKQTMEIETLREALAEKTKSRKVLFLNKRTGSQEERS